MEFLTVEQTCALLQWRRREVLAALAQGVLVGIKAPASASSGNKWAIVHPGANFVEYLRNPESRLPYITLLTVKDIAFILGITTQSVLAHVRKGNIKPNVFRDQGRSDKTAGYFFAPIQVRNLILRLSKGHPTHNWRPPIPDEVMKEFFRKSMIPKVAVDPLTRINAELEWICRTPEPERSLELAKLMRQAEEIYNQQQEELSRPNGTNAPKQSDELQEAHSGV